MAGNRFLGPTLDSGAIRKPTDGSLDNGNIRNPPRFANLGMGGLNSGGARGVMKNEYDVEVPGSTLRKMPNKKGADT